MRSALVCVCVFAILIVNVPLADVDRELSQISGLLERRRASVRAEEAASEARVAAAASMTEAAIAAAASASLRAQEQQRQQMQLSRASRSYFSSLVTWAARDPNLALAYVVLLSVLVGAVSVVWMVVVKIR